MTYFAENPALYAAARPRYPARLATELARHCPSHAHAWDAGCGSGQLSVVLAVEFDRITATDVSPEQLAHAASHPRIEYHVANANAAPIPDHSVDLAVAAQAAHWFDLPQYFDEVRRVAKPGAIVALITYELARVTPAVDQVVAAFYRGPLLPHWPRERRHVERHYTSLHLPFPELDFPPLEMTATWNARQMLDYISTWSAVRLMLRAAASAAFDEFAATLRQAWGDPAQPRHVAWPLYGRIGRVP